MLNLQEICYQRDVSLFTLTVDLKRVVKVLEAELKITEKLILLPA